MNCMIRMNPDWVVVWPKVLPGANVLLPCSARTVGRLKRFSTSSLICADFVPKLKFFMNDASVLNCVGERRSVMVRGTFVNAPNGVNENAAGLIQVAVG